MELSSMKICAAIPTSRALPEVVRRMPRKRISGLEALLQQDPTIGPWEMEKELIFSPWRVFLKLLILSVSAVKTWSRSVPRVAADRRGFSLVNTVKAGMIISFPSNNIYSSVCCCQSEIFKYEFSNSKKSSWIQEERHLGRNNVLCSAHDVSPEKVTSALNKQTNNNNKQLSSTVSSRA
ncbi:uncharacterized protein encoded by LINC01551-like [Pongo pygmaeus]|uniref:uncharacterized protein encoded by LINC01551-like n=1 Tax=Pongo pygmaeus TaxID=9600 RepID=UPI0023E28EE6|nr:uncharacterized protein encoded by LINC01551-like [Pongo pygmaeus]